MTDEARDCAGYARPNTDPDHVDAAKAAMAADGADLDDARALFVGGVLYAHRYKAAHPDAEVVAVERSAPAAYVQQFTAYYRAEHATDPDAAGSDGDLSLDDLLLRVTGDPDEAGHARRSTKRFAPVDPARFERIRAVHESFVDSEWSAFDESLFDRWVTETPVDEWGAFHDDADLDAARAREEMRRPFERAVEVAAGDHDRLWRATEAAKNLVRGVGRLAPRPASDLLYRAAREPGADEPSPVGRVAAGLRAVRDGVASRLPGHETDERRVDGFVDAAWEAVTTNGYDPERVETLLDEYGLADRSASLAGEVKERARRWAERSYEARADREGAYAVVHEPDEGPVRVLTTPGAAGVRFGDKHVEHDVDVAAPIDDLRVEDVHETDAEADLVFTNNVFDYADPGAVVERVAADDGAHVEYLGRDRADEAVRSADAGTRLVDGDVKASGYHKGRHRVVAVDPDGAERDRWLVPGETAAGEDETPDHGAGRSA